METWRITILIMGGIQLVLSFIAGWQIGTWVKKLRNSGESKP